MGIGPFLRREAISSVRHGGARRDRVAALVLTTAILTGCLGAWGWFGWDRASVDGAAAFGRVTFGLIVTGQKRGT